MLRRGGDPNNNTARPCGPPRRTASDGGHSQGGRATTAVAAATIGSAPRRKPIRGLLKLIQGQIGKGPTGAFPYGSGGERSANANPVENATVSVYRYHGETLRASQLELQKKRRRRTRRSMTDQTSAVHADEECGGTNNAVVQEQLQLLQLSSASMPFVDVVNRHRFVAFFVIQGWRRAGTKAGDTDTGVGDRFYYSAHTLALRKLLATDYHDVMSTFVVDLTDGCGGGGDIPLPFCDEETGFCNSGSSNSGNNNNHKDSEGTSRFCRGTGFAVLPCTGGSNPRTGTLLALLGGVGKVPAVVVVDTASGRALSGDAVLAIQRNDPHSVVNRWQRGSSGLTPCQAVCSALVCESEARSCCAVQ